MAAVILAVMLSSPAPVALAVVFAAVWVFGAAMLWWFPTFGAIGTALYGVILGADLVAMHGASPLNLAVAAGCLAGTVLAIVVLVELRRR